MPTLDPEFAGLINQGLARFWVIRVFWFLVIALWPLVFFVPETHGPTILLRRAIKLRKEGAIEYYAAQELEKTSMRQLLAKHIGRPIGRSYFIQKVNWLKAVSSNGNLRTNQSGCRCLDFFSLWYNIVSYLQDSIVMLFKYFLVFSLKPIL